jgi:acyl-CoA dehydrogenase
MIRDAQLLDELVDSVHRFVRQRLVPIEDRVAREDAIPPDVVADMRAMGLFGMTIPEEYGGLGLTMEEEATVAIELGRTSPAFRSLIGTNNGIGSLGLIVAGTPAQKSRYLPAMAAGNLVSAFALTEPDAGSDAASLRTSAIVKDGHYVLNGTKRFITNAPQAGLFTVFARTASGISAFLVEADTPGLLVGLADDKMGQKGAQTADVVLQDCRVPNDAMLGAEGEGFGIAMRTLDRGRLHIAAVCVGLAERLIRDALHYAGERKQFGKPIAAFQLIQAMLADSQAETYAARCMTLDAARRRDAGEEVGMQASCCKLFASEMLGRVADRAVQIHGGAGYMREYAVERFYRDVRLYRIYEGTSQIQQLLIARRLMQREGIHASH